tara:strand:- start:26501 stop:27289 length:789 start_codon:yes stop_codon:yes gene_type:complete
MSQYIIDFIVILMFAYIARMFWKIANRKQTKHIKLLFQTIAIFIVAHLIIFPLIYMILINQNVSNIKIEKDIITYERNQKLEKAFDLERMIEQDFIRKEKPQLETFINKYSYELAQINWNNFDNKRIVKFDSLFVRGNTESFAVPGRKYYKVIQVYNSEGFKLFEFRTQTNNETLLPIFNSYLEEIESDRINIKEQIKSIKNDQFWTYRQILPYTLNILFTDNFNPQSRVSNFIYFIHNILVLGFLISVIMNLFQSYLLNKK